MWLDVVVELRGACRVGRSWTDARRPTLCLPKIEELEGACRVGKGWTDTHGRPWNTL